MARPVQSVGAVKRDFSWGRIQLATSGVPNSGDIGSGDIGFDFRELVAAAEEQFAKLKDVQRRRAELMASATVADKMVTVHVNASGVVIKTEIDEDFLDDHDLEDLAGYFTEAAQQAAAEVSRRGEAMLEPLQEGRLAMPSLSDIIAQAPDLRDFAITAEDVSTAPPESRDRSTATNPGSGRWQ